MADGNKHEFRVRAVTSFLCLKPDDFISRADKDPGSPSPLQTKISKYATFLKQTEQILKDAGYEVQTLRIATNPFGEYLAPASEIDTLKKQLAELDDALQTNSIGFFALGPATNPTEVDCCRHIVSTSNRLSCSAELSSGNDVMMAKKAAECMKIISQLDAAPHLKNGLGNFQFCATACCKPYIPFFPAARSTSLLDSLDSEKDVIPFALGLENGNLAQRLLSETKSIGNISTTFRDGMAAALTPLASICESIANGSSGKIKFVGIDTSLNPSLEEGGSAVVAIEKIDVVEKFGGRGSIAVAAEITKALKSLPGVQNVGYSGLMLPVCEDRRLAELASAGEIDTTRLLAISSVCGVGLDTVPVSGSATTEELMGLILDVGSLAFRYDKSLSCRLLLCPGQIGGEEAKFNSPYMCDCKIFTL